MDTTFGGCPLPLILIVHLSGTVLLRATTEVLAKQKCFLHSYDSSMEETVD
jgi:hypothetical protein